MTKSFHLAALVVLASFFSTSAFSQSGAVEVPARDFSYTISTSQVWTDTGVDLQSGDLIEINAEVPAGNGIPDRHAIAASTCDPNGVSSAAKSASLPVPAANPGAFLVKLGAQSSPILVGNQKELRAELAGHLFLGVNYDGTPPCAGSFAVKVHITSGGASPAASAVPAATSAPAANPAAAAAASTPDMAKDANSTTATDKSAGTAAAQNGQASADIKKKLEAAAQVWLQGQFGGDKAAANSTSPSSAVGGNSATPSTTASTLELSKDKLDPELAKDINGMPRRVNDQFNNMGDMVNFVIVGSKDQLQAALDAANWHIADTNNTESVMKAVLETYQKKDYLTMPMSPLRLYGRVQDYGYEMAEPYSVVASRHHFRIWKAPFTYKGQTVWVGAGTHDIGFEKDQRNGSVTHKIDPAVDGERENVGSSLQKAGKVKTAYLYLPPNPVQDARNATGGGYRSDGRILVMMLK